LFFFPKPRNIQKEFLWNRIKLKCRLSDNRKSSVKDGFLPMTAIKIFVLNLIFNPVVFLRPIKHTGKEDEQIGLNFE
jgi:hypothetical protein